MLALQSAMAARPQVAVAKSERCSPARHWDGWAGDRARSGWRVGVHRQPVGANPLVPPSSFIGCLLQARPADRSWCARRRLLLLPRRR